MVLTLSIHIQGPGTLVRQEEVRLFPVEAKACVRELWWVETLLSIHHRLCFMLRTEGVRRVDGEAEDMERGQITKTLVWQAKGFSFYSETTGVCWKEFERGRDMAISVVGKVSLATLYRLSAGWAAR